MSPRTTQSEVFEKCGVAVRELNLI